MSKKAIISQVNKFRIGIKNDKRVKLTTKQKNKIIQLSKEGETNKDIASEYGVSSQTIYYIINPHKLVEMREKQKKSGKVYSYTERNKKHYEHKKQLLLKKQQGNGGQEKTL